jgi:hypothetical protein
VTDGVTASTIYTDYCNIEIVLNTPSGYDVLSSENPRRDDGKGNMLLVRKETKEIKTVFSRDNTSGVISYGDYNPKQGILPSSLTLVGGYSLVMPKAYLTTLTTRATGMVFNSKTYFNFLDEYSAIDSVISSSLTDGSQLYADTYTESTMLIPSNVRGTQYAYKNVNIGKIVTSNNTSLALDDTTYGLIAKFIDNSMINNSNSAYISLLVFLVKDATGNLYLLVSAYPKYIFGKTTYHALVNASGRLLAFRLANRPLTK